MLIVTNSLDTAMAESHRHDLLRIAADTKRGTDVAQDVDDQAAAPLIAADRRLLFSSLAEMWETAIVSEVETVDPLGVWSCGLPRRPLPLPEARTLIDWGAWLIVVALVSGYLVLAG
jgi:hypothetical protein